MDINNEMVQASFDGDIEKVRSLIEIGINIDAMGEIWNPLHAAIENMRIEVVKYLLDEGADLEYICLGMRPLHHSIDIEMDVATQANASECSEPIFTQMLVEAGADFDGLDDEGKTPLQTARERGHKKAEILLQSRGAA